MLSLSGNLNVAEILMSTYVNTTFYLRSCELKIEDVLTTVTAVLEIKYTLQREKSN